VAPDGGVYAPGDLAAQTRRCLDIISQALADAGADLGSVVRTRVFLTDVTRWREAAEVHGAFFGEVRPAASFIGCSALINPDWLVEVEAEALIS
jgi:enamine deaminase RidA (YjgF/YER057c/UK114 family)